MKKIISVILALFMLAGCTKVNLTKTKTLELYFLSIDGSKIVFEERNVSAEDSELLQVTADELLKGPLSADHKRIIPQGTKVISTILKGTVAEVNFSKEFDEGTMGERLMSRYTAIYTFCALPGIKKVKLLVEGKDLYNLSTGEVLEPIGSEELSFKSPIDDDKIVVTLYFSDKNALYLIPETRRIEIKEGEKLEEVVVKEIIKGPMDSSKLRTVTEDVKVLSAETKEDVCFVNLSQEFVIKNTGGSTKEMMAVYSIVNSLCKLDKVKKVRFLIEGETVESFGHFTFNEPFSEDKAFYNEGANE